MKLIACICLPCPGFGIPVYTDGEKYYFHRLENETFRIESFYETKYPAEAIQLPEKKTSTEFHQGQCGAIIFYPGDQDQIIAGRASEVKKDLEEYFEQNPHLVHTKEEFDAHKEQMVG